MIYLLAIVAANLLAARLGPAVTVPTALVLIGLDLTARDQLHDAWRGRGLFPRMATLIAAGSILSWALNHAAGRIATASLVAFAGAGAVDALTYHLLGDRARLVRVNGSNVLAAAVDSFAFPALAWGLPLVWPVMIGQLLAKTAGGLAWSLILPEEVQP